MIIINCKGKILGRISTVISKMLIFLNNFKKNIFFILYNIIHIKIKNKLFFKHSGYIGNIKKCVKNNNIFYFKKSIFNMLPKNKTRIHLMKKIFFLNTL